MAFIYVTLSIISILLVVSLLFKRILWRGRQRSVENKHVVVTGGSSGIGKCVAILAAQHGAHVTIVARDVQKLKVAQQEIQQASRDKDVQKIQFVALDISKSYEEVEKAMSDIEKTMGPIYMLVNCAGLARCGKMEDISIPDMHRMMDVNFFGTYYCIKAVTQRLKTRRSGIIVLTASQAALLGIFGYSGYCSTKFALRGLAESIAMELAPYNISITLALPPDTDTPGFAEEELSKPLETKLITHSQVSSPDDVARRLFTDALSGRFFSTVGMDGFIMTNMCCGMSPMSSVNELFLQSSLMGVLRIVGVCYLLHFQRIISRCMKIRDKNKKSE